MNIYKHILLILTILFIYTGSAKAFDDKWNVLTGYSSKSFINSIIGISPENPFWKYLKKYDTNGDGKITGEEWANFYRDLQSEQQGDPGMGFLCTTEEELSDWLTGYPGVNRNTANNMAHDIMQEFDTDPQDGKLSPSELNNFVRSNTPAREISPPEPIPV